MGAEVATSAGGGTPWGAIAGATSGLMGLALANTQRKQQMRDQRQLMGLQLGNQMTLNRQQQELAMKMWNDTNYDAQRQQMEKAGLNVGMMYGGSGAGGATTGGAQGGSAGSAQAPGYDNSLAGMGIQLGMQQAQMDLIKAQTRKLNAEAGNEEGGIKTGLELQNRNQELKNSWQQWDNDMKAYDANRQPEFGRLALEKLAGDTEKAVAEGKISKETADEQIKIAELEVFEKQINNELTGQKITESKENVKLMAQKIEESIKWLEQNGRSVTAEEVKADAQKRLADFNTGTGAQIERGGRILNGAVDAVMKVYKPKPSVKMTKEHYDGSDKSYTKTTTTNQ